MNRLQLTIAFLDMLDKCNDEESLERAADNIVTALNEAICETAADKNIDINFYVEVC